MFDLLTTHILAARGRDDEDPWIQILVFILFAVIYAIGGIIKARSAKQQKKAEAPPRRLRPQPHAPHIRLRPEITPQAPSPPAPRPHIPRRPAPPPRPMQPRIEPAALKSPAQPATPAKAVAILPELEEPEALRRAILYYEILGKPVSLRTPRDPLIGR
jgi:hypothetical protein